jgi:predicted transcriptional regulator of viral defense system
MKSGGDTLTQERLAQIRSSFENEGPILRASQLLKHGVCSKDIRQLLSNNDILRIKAGYYVWKDRIDQLSDNQIAVSVIPNATLYYLSAAEQYGFTTVIPDAVHIAVPNAGQAPKPPDFPPIRITQFMPPLFYLGRTAITIDSFILPIYDRERTVCDIFKRRDEIGDDVALEIIREYMRGARNIQRLYEYARKMRLEKKLYTYVEALA